MDKRQNIEVEGELVEVVKDESKKIQVNIKGLAFEMQQYEFSEVPKTSIDKFKSRAELYDKYKNNRDASLDESMKLYVDVRKISNKEVSLVTVKDHAKNNLNLVVSTKNKIA